MVRRLEEPVREKRPAPVGADQHVHAPDPAGHVLLLAHAVGELEHVQGYARGAQVVLREEPVAVVEHDAAAPGDDARPIVQ